MTFPIPSYMPLMQQQVTILRAALVQTQYGEQRDWQGLQQPVQQTVISALCYPSASTENDIDMEFQTDYWVMFCSPYTNIVFTDRVVINNEIPGTATVTCRVEGQPFIFNDQLGRSIYMQVKLKMIDGG